MQYLPKYLPDDWFSRDSSNAQQDGLFLHGLFITNFKILQERWQELIPIVKDTEVKAMHQSVCLCTKSWFWVLLYGMVFAVYLKHTDNLSKTLQPLQMSAPEGHRLAEMTILTP